MARWPIPAQTAAAQRRAANPRRSAWVRANAGSGKTHVLAQRVVRLLLTGADPAKILCLTFTKAAAANMSMRVFSILSKWTEYENEKLLSEIRALGMRDFDKPDLARRLFARAVETPGGLKIQTIHAFCERVLHLFPFEANVPARFEAVDEQRQAMLLEESRNEVLLNATMSKNSALANAMQQVASQISRTAFEKLLREAVSKRKSINDAGKFQGGGFGRALGNHIGLAPGDELASIETAILDEGISAERWQEILPALDLGSTNDNKLADRIRTAKTKFSLPERLEAYLEVFYTKDEGKIRGGKGSKLTTKKIDTIISESLTKELHRIIPLVEKLKAARIVQRSVSFQMIADNVLANYTRLKNIHGLLDFEDLVERTESLLSRSDAAWVLYKLDAGIDHVLVDEAQDTSPQQWRILTSLVSDFFAGEGARAAGRTFFAVGDEKQSIFSFQGAAPREFGQNAKIFGKTITDAEMRFKDVELTVSFRSSDTILQCVDTVFSTPENYNGLSFDDRVKTVHSAWKSTLPGLVEIWEPIAAAAKREPDDWLMPVDALSEHSPAALLATRIASKIKSLLDTSGREAVHGSDGVKRAIRAGDIMILVRRRNQFFDSIIKALKMAGVPVAGADRLKMMEHIAVMDLTAAGRAALLPEDDLTLASVLKSPFFGYDDADLIRLAPNRKASLFEELRISELPRDQAAHARINTWGIAAKSSGPFAFFAQILGAEQGRREILARLGAEAGDAIDEFLRLALQWEHDEPASLTAFLHSMQSADLEIKRDMEAAGEAVRVMTVHAAKGLEAKIVFLPDTCAAPSGHHDPGLVEITLSTGENVPVWRSRSKDNPAIINTEMDRLRSEQSEEYRRLLYVAMTRAEERLYISGYLNAKGIQAGSWFEMIQRTLSPLAVNAAAHWAEGKVMRIGDRAQLDEIETSDDTAGLPESPDWLFSPAAAEAAPAPPVRPSHAMSAADQLEDSTGAATSRRLAMLEGTLCHALLQYLPDVPPDDRLAAASRFMAHTGRSLEPQRQAEIIRQSMQVIDDPRLAPIFSPDARAEISIAGRVKLPSGREVEIAGRIDRLGQTPDRVLIVDFKTGAPSANTETPRQYLTQMALYRAALAPLFPGRLVQTMIVWTAGPEIDELSPASLEAALATLAG